MAKARIDDIEHAIIAAIRTDATLAGYVREGQVQGLSDRAIDQNGEIILTPPGVLVMSEGGSYDGGELTGTRYTIREQFLLVAVAQNLRDGDEERHLAYKLLEDLKQLFAGRNLNLPNGGQAFTWLAGHELWGRNAATHLLWALRIGARGNWDAV